MKRWAQRSHVRGSSDDGMSIIGVVIASFLILLTLIPAADLIENTLAVSSNNQRRVVAANLATQQMETIRAQAQGNFSTLLSNYSITGTSASSSASSTITINQVAYNVDTTLSWSSSNFAQGGCSSNFTSGYSASTIPPVLEASVVVTWPNDRLGQPLSLSEALNAPSSLFGGTDGSVLVSVVSASGSPQATVPVNLETSTGLIESSSTTDINGCAFFPNVTPSSAGSDIVTISKPTNGATTYVNQASIPNPTQAITVSAGTTSALQFTYDEQATFDIQGETEQTIASQFGLSANDNYLSTQGDPQLKLEISGDNYQTSAPIFPATSGYQTWLGTCSGFLPSSTFQTAVSVSPDQTTSIPNLAFSTINAIFVNSSATPEPSSSAIDVYVWQYATSSSTSSCLSSPIKISVITGATGNANLNLPVGYFEFAAVTSGSSAPTSPSTSLVDATNPTGGAVPITVTVT